MTDKWLKGPLLTWLSHMRAPGRLWRELGARGFFGLNVVFLGAAATYLAMPLFWIAVIGGALTGRTIWGEAMPGWALWPLGASLAIGQAVMLGCAVLAMLRRGTPGLLIWVPTLPFYWTLGAVAAWKAVFDMVWEPYRNCPLFVDQPVRLARGLGHPGRRARRGAGQRIRLGGGPAADYLNGHY